MGTLQQQNIFNPPPRLIIKKKIVKIEFFSVKISQVHNKTQSRSKHNYSQAHTTKRTAHTTKRTVQMETLIRINGYYDIVCGLCLLGYFDLPIFSTLHSNMFSQMLDPMAKRFLGMFILLQGCCRMTYSAKTSPNLIIASYGLEALLFIRELLIHKTVDDIATYAVIAACMWFMFICSNISKKANRHRIR